MAMTAEQKERRAYIESKSTSPGKNGFKRAVLADFGVPWPPPKGWKSYLILNGFPFDLEKFREWATPAKPATAREKRLAAIRRRADRFFDFPDPENRTYVTLTSAVLFAERVLDDADKKRAAQTATLNHKEGRS